MSYSLKTYRIIIVALFLSLITVGSVAVYYSPIVQGFYANPSMSGVLATQQSFTTSTVIVPSNPDSISPVQIYQAASSSVVTITGVTSQVGTSWFGRPVKSIVSVLGTGFVVTYNDAYYVLTNFHVVDGLVNATVAFSNGNQYRAHIVGSDQYSDFAVVSVKASASEFHPVLLGSSSNLKVGQSVVAIGNPFGLSGTITVGIISQLGRVLAESDSTGGNTIEIADTIQFSAPINEGNSGGPLITGDGMVVGVATAVVSGSQGVSFAIPSDTVTRELPYLVKDGKYTQHPYLGADFIDMNYDVAQAMHTTVTSGVLVEGVVSGGPADKAGLRRSTQRVTIGGQRYLIGGDIVTSVDGNSIINYDALSAYLERHVTPGQTVQLGIFRQGNQMTIPLNMGSLG